MTGLAPLATVADVEALYGPMDEASVDQVTRLLGVASAAVRRYTRQVLSPVADDTVVVPSSGTTVLALGQRPVVAVASVAVQSHWGWGGWWPTEPAPLAGWHDAGRFTWDAWGTLRRLDGLVWGRKYDPVQVVYSHGYDPVPADVVGLVAGKVASFLAGTAANPDGLRSLQVGAMSETYANAAGSAAALGPAGLTEAEREQLDDYRLRAVAVDIGTQ